MHDDTTKRETSIRNSAFSAFLCAALGFVLLEAWIVRLGGKPIAHVIIVCVGAIVASAIYRAIVSRAAAGSMQPREAVQGGSGKRRGAAHIACAALLLIFGYAGARALSTGSMTLFAAFAACACVFPWSKLALCRSSILVPAAIIGAAMVLGLPAARQAVHPLIFPAAVWMLWMGAVSAWLTTIFFRQRQSRASRLPAHHQNEQANVV